jgi:hypothetical protein
MLPLMAGVLWQSLDLAKKGKEEEVPHRGVVPA